DCVTYALIARYRPATLEGTRILARTVSAPALPYVTAGNADAGQVERLRAGVRRAFTDPDLAAARAALLLTGAEGLPLSAYDRINEIERDAIAAGYPVVA